MIHCEVKDIYKKRYAALWSALSFKAGFINAAGFLATGSYVSHVTGFGTQVGLSLGHQDYVFGLGLLTIPVTFIFGGVITSFILDRKYSHSEIPNYPLVQGLITFLLGLIAILGEEVFLNRHVPLLDKYEDLLLITLICLVCGLKNSLTTWATAGKIRTTHLTGLSTDIGLNFLNSFRSGGHLTRHPEKKSVNWIRILILVSFSTGSCISAMIFPYLGYKIFVIPFLISSIFLIISIAHRRKKMEFLNFISGKVI